MNQRRSYFARLYGVTGLILFVLGGVWLYNQFFLSEDKLSNVRLIKVPAQPYGDTQNQAFIICYLANDTYIGTTDKYLFVDIGNGPIYVDSLGEEEPYTSDAYLSEDKTGVLVWSNFQKKYVSDYDFTCRTIMGEKQVKLFSNQNHMQREPIFDTASNSQIHQATYGELKIFQLPQTGDHS